MKRESQLKKMFAALALGGLMLVAPQLAKADVASDIAAGKDAAVVAQQAVKGGMTPRNAAIAAVKANPKSAVAIAAGLGQANPDAAADVAVALAQEQPEQAVAIVQTLSQLYPDRTQEIAAAVIKAICGGDKKGNYASDKKGNNASDKTDDVCAALYATNPGIEAYEGDTQPVVPPNVIDNNPGTQDNLPASAN